MTDNNVLTISPTGKARVYKSLRATSRTLSGDGTDSKRNAIARRCSSGGGFIGGLWVQYTGYPAGQVDHSITV